MGYFFLSPFSWSQCWTFVFEYMKLLCGKFLLIFSQFYAFTEGLMALLGNFGKAYLYLAHYDLNKAIESFLDLPMPQQNTPLVLSYCGKAHVELHQYKEAVRWVVCRYFWWILIYSFEEVWSLSSFQNILTSDAVKCTVVFAMITRVDLKIIHRIAHHGALIEELIRKTTLVVAWIAEV